FVEKWAGSEEQLEVWKRQVRAATHESVRLAGRRTEQAATPVQVIGELHRFTGREAGVALRLEPEHRAEVILEILTDLRGMVDHCDAVGTQLLAVADAGKHQQLGGIDRASAQYD